MEVNNKENSTKLESEELEDIVKQIEKFNQENSVVEISSDDDNEETQLFEVDENEKMENEDELSMFNKRLKEKEAEIAENNAKFQRLQADFTNYKKRVEKEKSEIFLYASEKLACELLEIIDNLERAVEQKQESTDNDVLRKGIELVLRKMKETFTRHNIKEIDAMGKPFDSNLHHAVMQEEESDVEANMVIAVLQKGYTINGKVIRPSMVKVSK
ncbi:MAG: nucleotide exchange factor GrpE [Clostridiales bacterium]|nr:nucleotide exchange factor GrpE [Clostridiales bacterium]